MKRWLSSQNRKIHQRRINYYMRKMNKNVESLNGGVACSILLYELGGEHE